MNPTLLSLVNEIERLSSRLAAGLSEAQVSALQGVKEVGNDHDLEYWAHDHGWNQHGPGNGGLFWDALQELVDDGYVTTQERVHPEAKQYQLTPKGERALRAV